ncbi:MAG: hypothetical protein H7645_09805 [Candidatus Heimdallarchaeota archaeon]|nr:hypothetical protein [Candidatus Heimdallarchaeota archaeon]MCK4770622.1 hypothetical protein [Candidatus Heimdallarchaeota archaeon]
MERNLTLTKIKTDLLFLILLCFVITFVFFATRNKLAILNWGVGIFSVLTLGVAFSRFRQTGFQFNQKTRLTACSSLDDFEDWFAITAVLIFIPLIPLDLIVKSISYIASK